MDYSVNREHIKKIAKELDIKVKLDSPTPGVLENGERKPLISYIEYLIKEEDLINEEENRKNPLTKM